MEPNAVGITSQELIGAAAAAGYSVTPTQLARWHRRGLLPRPEKQHLGRHGSASLYPSGTEGQLLAICEIHTRTKALNQVAWHLWWNRYNVPIHLVREVLTSRTERVRRDLAAISRIRLGAGGEWGDAEIEQLSEGRLNTNSPAALVRRRVGRAAFPQVVAVLSDVAGGTYVAGGARSGPDSDSYMVRKAVSKILMSPAKAQPPALPRDLASAEDLEDLSARFGANPLAETLSAATDAELTRAREAAISLINSMDAAGLSYSDGLLSAVTSLAPHAIDAQMGLMWASMQMLGPGGGSATSD